MSDTPRTDAQNPITPSEVDDVWIYNAPMVNADFARQLERELAAAAIELRTLRTANAGLLEKVAETQAALDLSARQLLETVNDRNGIGVQLDLLRDELMRIQARIAETGLIGEHPQLSSIASYCERAQKDIAVQYTPIQERDRLGRELTEAKRGAARYEVVRKMTSDDFRKLYLRCIFENIRFDDEVDRIGGLQ